MKRLILLSLVAAMGAAGTAMGQVEEGKRIYLQDRVIRIVPAPRPPGSGGWVWVEAVYQTVSERVWVGDRVERVPVQYWISGTYGWRTVIYCDEFGQRSETREWGEISPGRYETGYREVVVAGHWETRERRVLVSAGYWRRVGVVVVPPVIVDPPIIIRPKPGNPGTVGVEGYSGGAGDSDAGKFSPLYEWPK